MENHCLSISSRSKRSIQQHRQAPSDTEDNRAHESSDIYLIAKLSLYLNPKHVTSIKQTRHQIPYWEQESVLRQLNCAMTGQEPLSRSASSTR